MLFSSTVAGVQVEAGGHKYEWDMNAISIDGKSIYEARSENSFKSKGEPCSGSESLEVLSVVGNIISFRVAGESHCQGSAYPNSWDMIKVIRFEDGYPSYINLNDLYSIDEIVSSLVEDKWVKSKYNNPKKKYLRSRLNPNTPKQCGELSLEALSSFSFHHIKNNKVAVRVYLPRCLHASTTVLGVYLDANGQLRKDLLTSDKKSLLENKIKTHNKSLNSTPKSGAN